MKKLLIGLLSITLCFTLGFSGNIFAQEPEDAIVLQDYGTGGDFTEANQAFVDLGRSLLLKRAYGDYRTLNMPHYYQNQQSWSNDLMKTLNLPIGSYGCTLTSFSMIANYYGSTDNPGQVNKKVGNYACEFYFAPAGAVYNLNVAGEVRKAVTNDYAYNYVAGAIMSGKPVLIGMFKGSSTHFVTAYSYVYVDYGIGPLYYIHDPTYGSNNKTQLSQYLNAGWQVNRLYVYSK